MKFVCNPPRILPSTRRRLAERQLAVKTQLFNDVPRETGFQLLKSQTAIPADASFVVNIGRKNMGFRKAHVLVVSYAFVAPITTARSKERKQVAQKIVVEVEKVAPIKRILIG